jgi:regulator of replication initiation timing
MEGIQKIEEIKKLNQQLEENNVIKLETQKKRTRNF